MSLKIDTVSMACKEVAACLAHYERNLTLHFIIHHEGELAEALSMATHEIASHPAIATALHIMAKRKNVEQSSYLGTAVARNNTFLGLSTRFSHLALCTLCLEQFDDMKSVKRYAYHMAWHALDAFDYYKDPGHQSGQIMDSIIRKRNALELTQANLQADVFSAIISYYTGDKDAVEEIGEYRCQNVLSSRTRLTPEFQPYVIALDAVKHCIDILQHKRMNDQQLVSEAYNASKTILKLFPNMAFKKWFQFARPAQDMAWRGFTKQEILSAAIHGCQDTRIRSIGYLVSETTHVRPVSIFDTEKQYNPYASDEYNQTLHESTIDRIYEDLILQDITDKSAAKFLDIANRQNQNLTEGNVIGWCASALHAAAMAYKHAISKGIEPDTLVRKTFKKEQDKTSWEDLSELGDKIVKKSRKDGMITMSDVSDLAGKNSDLRSVQKSLNVTVNDPTYQKQLENSQSLDANLGQEMAPRPTAPGIKTPAPATPAVAISVPTPPGMGGGMGGRSAPPVSSTLPPVTAQRKGVSSETKQSDDKKKTG